MMVRKGYRVKAVGLPGANCSRQIFPRKLAWASPRAEYSRPPQDTSSPPPLSPSMVWQPAPDAIPLMAAASVCAALGVFGYRHRRMQAATGFVLLMAASAWWAFF